MATLSSTVNDIFLTRIKDYRLDTIYNTSGSLILNEYLEAWLIDAAVEFSDFCDQDLTYVVSSSTIEGYFTSTLTTKNIVMLSKLMVKYWMAKTVSDLLQMQNFVTDRDFKSFSSAQNLHAKQEHYNNIKEELSQDLINYSYKINDWSSWNNQIFNP